MITVQILSKLIRSGDPSLLVQNCLEEKYFPFYEKPFNFIKNHFEKYGKIPDRETFAAKFPDFKLVEVSETDEYLIDSLFEEHLYNEGCKVVVKVAELLKSDANEAVDYMVKSTQNLIVERKIGGVDIIKNAASRYQQYLEKQNATDGGFIPSGFIEQDAYTGGWSKGEEFVVIFARTGQGKSWYLVKTLSHAWQLGYRVGYISPEMTANKLGYRFDTVNAGISNTVLTRGYKTNDYEAYIKTLQTKETPFIVSSPKDFQRKITVSKLKNFCIINNLGVLAIDGIGYMVDERLQRGDRRDISLANISEDLMSLSCELKIPIIVVTQSNRGGADKEKFLDITNIRDSDGIAYNASKIWALKQDGIYLDVDLQKFRDGTPNKKFTYVWEADIGKYTYTSRDAAPKQENKDERPKNKTVVF
jgi:replicative DNA helicase